jgi:SHS2 domain-containing protein
MTERAGDSPGARESNESTPERAGAAREPASPTAPASPTTAHEFFDVEADVGVHAWGPTRAEAFARAAEGLLALGVTPSAVASNETREARAQATSLEALLVNWLNECLYVHEIEGFAVARVEVDTCRDDFIHGVLHGEVLDPGRHPLGTIVKAATHHQVDVREIPGRVDVRVVVDI